MLDNAKTLFTSALMKFSIARTLCTDWPALAAWIGVPMFWIIHFLFPRIRPGVNDPPPIAIAVSATLLCAAVLLWRFHRVSRLFKLGRTAPGTITRLSIARDRGRLEFAFEHGGEMIFSWTPVHKHKAILALQPGDSVEVLFDPEKPTTAIVKHLYTS